MRMATVIAARQSPTGPAYSRPSMPMMPERMYAQGRKYISCLVSVQIIAFVGLPIDWKKKPEGMRKPTRKITPRKMWKHLSAKSL